MQDESVKSIFPFVPAEDFELATQFYKDLGFTCPQDEEGVRVFRKGDFGFLLQDHYVEDWASNFMMNMHVDDAQGWHDFITEAKLIEKYPGTSLSKPALEDWGMIVMHLVDPTGILWHITQRP